MDPYQDPYRSPQAPSQDQAVYRISKLEVGEIIEQAFKLTTNHLGLFLGIAAILLIPMQVVLFGVSLLVPIPARGFNQQGPPNPQDMEKVLTALVVALPLSMFYFWVVEPITEAALIHAIASKYLGTPVTIGNSFAKVFRHALPIIGTSIMVNLAIVVGLFLCCAPGIIAYFLFALAIPIVVVEGISGFTAMQRSMFLMKDNYLTLLVLAVLLFGIRMAIGLGLNFIPTIYLHAPLQIAVVTLLTIFQSALFVVFYFSARCKHENFDLDILAANVDESPLPGKPGPAF